MNVLLSLNACLWKTICRIGLLVSCSALSAWRDILIELTDSGGALEGVVSGSINLDGYQLDWEFGRESSAALGLAYENHVEQGNVDGYLSDSSTDMVRFGDYPTGIILTDPISATDDFAAGFAFIEGFRSYLWLPDGYTSGSMMSGSFSIAGFGFDDLGVVPGQSRGVTLANGSSITFTATTQQAESDWDSTGTQGTNHWYYGYRIVPLDTSIDAPYDPENDFRPFPASWWIGSGWDEPNQDLDNIPWTAIDENTARPNGDNNGEVHWPIRRWVSDVSGSVRVEWSLAKSNPNCGNGVTGGVWLNGMPQSYATIAFDDTNGVSRTVDLAVEPGYTVDLVLSPRGADGADNDGCDTSAMAMRVTELASSLIAIESLTLSESGEVVITVSGSAGNNISIETSSDGANWQAVGDYTMESDSVVYSFPGFETSEQQRFRLRNADTGAVDSGPIPVVTESFQAVTAPLGQSVTLQTGISSENTIITWKLDGVLLEGTNGVDHTIDGVSAADAGTYRIQAINRHGFVREDIGSIAIEETPLPECLFSDGILLNGEGMADLGDGNGPQPVILYAGAVMDNGFGSGLGYTVLTSNADFVGNYLHLQGGDNGSLDFYFKSVPTGDPFGGGSGPPLVLTVTDICTLGAALPEFGGPTPLPGDGQWTPFRWAPAIGNTESLDGPYTFTIPAGQSGVLDVTDIGYTGDVIEVLNNGTPLPSGSTSEVPFVPGLQQSDPELAFNESSFSSGSFPLGPGDYSIQLRVFEHSAATMSGGGSLRLVLSDVSDPYDSFAESRFTESEKLDPTVSGKSANPDGDWITNEFERLFNLDPKSADDPIGPGGVETDETGVTQVILDFIRDPRVAGEFTYRVEGRRSLDAQGIWTTTESTEEIVPIDDSHEKVIVTVTLEQANATRYFLRLVFAPST